MPWSRDGDEILTYLGELAKHFKKIFGLTRKYAIPLLEFLDRERVTRRAGEGRQLVDA